MFAAMRAALVVAVLGEVLEPVPLGLRRARDGGVPRRLLGVLEDMGGPQSLAGAPGGLGVAGNLR